MATYEVNVDAVAKARDLIDADQYTLDSDWSEAQPDPDEENADLERHDYEQYALWHLAIDLRAGEDTKGRYAFPYGDFRRVHRSGLIAAKGRAAQNGHDAVADAAGDLLDYLDRQIG
jgi:hypothetical protein